MGKWTDTLKNMQPGGFGSFGSTTTGHIPEKKPALGGFGSFGSTTTGRFHKISDTEFRRQARAKLEAAAQGLPVTMAELEQFFSADLPDIADMPQVEVKRLANWYAYTHLGRRDPIPEPIPKQAGMVRCTDCLQDRCKYTIITPWGSVEMQSSPRWRWCNDYRRR